MTCVNFSRDDVCYALIEERSRVLKGKSRDTMFGRYMYTLFTI